MMAHAEGKQCPLENVDGDEVLNAEWKPFTYMGIKAGANHLLTNTVADTGTAYGAYAGRRSYSRKWCMGSFSIMG